MTIEIRGEQMDLMDKRHKRKVRGMPGVHYSYGGGYVLPNVGWIMDPESGDVVPAGSVEGGSGGGEGGGDGGGGSSE